MWRMTVFMREIFGKQAGNKRAKEKRKNVKQEIDPGKIMVLYYSFSKIGKVARDIGGKHA